MIDTDHNCLFYSSLPLDLYYLNNRLRRHKFPTVELLLIIIQQQPWVVGKVLHCSVEPQYMFIRSRCATNLFVSPHNEHVQYPPDVLHASLPHLPLKEYRFIALHTSRLISRDGSARPRLTGFGGDIYLNWRRAAVPRRPCGGWWIPQPSVGEIVTPVPPAMLVIVLRVYVVYWAVMLWQSFRIRYN